MDEIMILCPVTERRVSTGILIDQTSFDRLPKVVSKLKCPHCGGSHSWTVADAWLAAGLSSPNGYATT